MPHSVWKGSISFGLVTVPIRLFVAARYSHVAFHEIHKTCGHRVQHQIYCPYDERVVTRDEIVMGYEVEKDKYVVVDPAELKKLQPQSSSVMEILQFVKLDEVDPIFFESSYFSVPEEAGARAYALLLKAMVQLKFAAIAKVTLHQRERTVIIRPYENGLTLHTIYYPDEIHELKEYGKSPKTELRKQEVTLAEQFAKSLVQPFKPAEFHDEYRRKVEQLVDSKNKGKALPRTEKQQKLAPVIDLMSALKKSLAGGKAAPKAAGSAKGKRLQKTA